MVATFSTNHLPLSIRTESTKESRRGRILLSRQTSHKVSIERRIEIAQQGDEQAVGIIITLRIDG